jgi:cytochrome c oxidase cbb3-type subunit III
MAAFARHQGGPLSGAEIRAVNAYLRTLNPVEPVTPADREVPGNAANGREVYAALCAECHGERLQGATAVSLANPVFLATASDGFIRYAIAEGRQDTLMASFRGALSEAEIDDVTAYIRSLARTFERPGEVSPPPPALTDVVVNPGGPPAEFPNLREGRYVAADDLKAQLGRGVRIVLVDARPTSDWVKGHLPGAVPVPFYDPDSFAGALPKDDTWIVAYCACPHAASDQVVNALREKGFERTAVLDEGVLVWATRGYPMVTGTARTATPEP